MTELHAMALDKAALLELTVAMSSTDGSQLTRRLLHTIPQALIDAEATEPHWHRAAPLVSRAKG